jgi:hypothetical protein
VCVAAGQQAGQESCADKALKRVADLSTLKFEEKVAPHKAAIW